MANYLNNTTNAQFIPTIIAQKALGRFGAYMNLAKTVSREFDWTTATVGSVISVPKRGALVANSKAAGTAVSLQNPTATNINVTLNQHYEVSFALDDVTAVLQNQDTMMGYAEDAAIALAEQVEISITSLYPSITYDDTVPATPTAAQVDSALLVLRKYFSDQKVPHLEKRYLYADPSLINIILTQDRYTRYDALGRVGGNIETESTDDNFPVFRPIYGFNIFESQNIQRSGSPAAFHNIAYTRNAFILASRTLPDIPQGYGAVSQVVADDDIGMGLRVVSSYDPTFLGVNMTLDVLWGVSILDQRRVAGLDNF